jgi:hypothetical protein
MLAVLVRHNHGDKNKIGLHAEREGIVLRLTVFLLRRSWLVSFLRD